MQIFINNKPAALKQGSSFDYVSENRLFSGSDGYTLNITFPLAGCPGNLEIFGNINRADVAAQKVVFDCELRDRSFCKVGSVVITEISEAEVKTQFLEGRSEQNFDKTFDKVYINELDLGAPEITSPSAITPSEAWPPVRNGVMEAVALPWWNCSDDGLAHNFTEFVNGGYQWSSSSGSLTWMPYLLFIARKICEAVGYSADFRAWENRDDLKYLLVCNVLPNAWDTPQYARALPHWTVDEFFEKLELFMGGEFTIDHRAKSISFEFTNDILSSTPCVELTRVVDEHTTEVTAEDENCDYLGARNLVYKDPGHDDWCFYSCNWFIRSRLKLDMVRRYDTLTELLADNKVFASWDGNSGRGYSFNSLLYAADVDTYFIVRAVDRTATGKKDVFGRNIYIYKCVCQQVNIFGGRIVDEDDDAEEEEIEFIPVRIADTEDKYGRCAFLEMNGFSEGSTSYKDSAETDAFWRPGPQQAIMAGKGEGKAEYYDSVFIGWWNGVPQVRGKLPYPYTEDITVADDWSGYTLNRFSLRLDSPSHRVVYPIDTKKKTTFKFLADSHPDVRALFLIRNKRYICERITATFTEDGMSRLLKGVFWPVEG